MPEAKSTGTLASAAGVLAGPISVRNSYLVDVSVDGLSADSVVLQRSLDGGTTWEDVETYTSDTEKVAQNGSPCQMRLNKSGTSDASVEGRLIAGNAY